MRPTECFCVIFEFPRQFASRTISLLKIVFILKFKIVYKTFLLKVYLTHSNINGILEYYKESLYFDK